MLLYQFSLDTHPVFTYFSQLNIVLCHCTSLASYSCFCVYSCKGNSYFLLGFRFIRLWKSKLFDGFVKIPSLCQCQKLTEPLIMIQSHHFAQIRGSLANWKNSIIENSLWKCVGKINLIHIRIKSQSECLIEKDTNINSKFEFSKRSRIQKNFFESTA